MARKKKALTMPEIQGITPNSREREIRVLAACINGDFQDQILDLEEDTFTHEDIRCIFRVMKETRGQNREVTVSSILPALYSDRLVLLTFEKMLQERMGGDWSGGVNEIKAEIGRVFQKLIGNYTDHLQLSYEIEELRRAYFANLGKKAAVILQNSDSITPEELNAYLVTLTDDLARATARNHASLFANKTREHIEARRKTNHDGIGTGYYVFSDGNRREITIPRGAISLVCGLPGHCKSTMLLNLALRLTHNENEEGSIIYWTFEESESKADEKIQNLNFGKSLNRADISFGGNVERIREYHKGNTSRIGDLQGFEESLKELERLETTGKFKLIETPISSLDFLSSLRAHIAKTGEKVAAVFVDYIQIIKSGRNLEKRHDIEEVVTDFLNFAKETNIPVIAAAQLNREATTPQSMGGRHISESQDLTRFADTILCLWNPVKSDDISLDETKFSRWTSGAWNKTHLVDHGCIIGEGGTLYVKIAKSRDMESGADAVYSYDGNTRTIGRTPREAYDMPEQANPDNLRKTPEQTKPTAKSWNKVK